MKKVLSVTILVIACILVASGLTLAYFYESKNIHPVHFTTGSVKVEVELENGDWDGWKPGNDKTIKWYFTNMGTIDATLAAEIKKEWDVNTVNRSVQYSVYENQDQGEPEVTWKLMDDNWELNDNTYCYKNTVRPNERVPLEFSLSIEDIPEGYAGADYNITLTITATQVFDE
ncbi:MAG: hypothetical protein GXZ01_06885 [Clostridiaceae bacterium]|nr:hypothetical protein [Clostridiaceae bacterium]